jgi:hypothetical protein
MTTNEERPKPFNAVIDLTGRTFGIWRVLHKSTRTDNKTRWACRCLTCGAIVIKRSSHLRSGTFAKCDGVHRDYSGRAMGHQTLKAAGYAAGTECYGNYRRRAREAGRAFTLTRADFQTITQLPCHYCGDPPAQVTKRRHFNGEFVYNGIDRRDSALGYTAENCLPCCGACNTMKSDMPYEEFLSRVARIANRLADYVPDPSAHEDAARKPSRWRGRGQRTVIVHQGTK